MSRRGGEARGLTLLVAAVCALPVIAAVSPGLANVLDAIFGWVFGLGALALLAGGLWWWLKGRDWSQPEPAQARSTPPESDAEPVDAVAEGGGAGT